MKITPRWLSIPIALVVVWLIASSPLPVPAYFDFQVIYHAGLGLLHGIPLYDHSGQVLMIAELAGVSPKQVISHPFPYPPWYGLIGMMLALLPITVAARLWFALNVGMLLLSAMLITVHWKFWQWMIVFFAMFLFPPVIGTLWVGQYVLPVLLGLSLLTYALQQRIPLLVAVASALLTFKPHLGGLILLILLVHLWLRRSDDFARRALWLIAATGVFLFVVGFLADPAWPPNYIQSLFGFKNASQCNGCVSLPMAIVSLFGLGIDQALLVAGILLFGLGFIFVAGKLRVLRNTVDFIVMGVCGVLMVSPYLQNYDFVLLLIPIVFLAKRAKDWRSRIIVATAYSLPWVGLLFGRQGNQVLLISALGLAYLLWDESRASNLSE